MARPDRIEGLAIVSADGMIADAQGVQPDALKLEADQRFFHAALDQATVLAHGKSSGEGGGDATRRRRLDDDRRQLRRTRRYRILRVRRDRRPGDRGDGQNGQNFAS